MTDMLIRNVDPKLKRELERRARAHGQSLSDEAKSMLRRGLDAAVSERRMGTWMRSLVRPEDRGDDLVFEYRGAIPGSPDFE